MGKDGTNLPPPTIEILKSLCPCGRIGSKKCSNMVLLGDRLLIRKWPLSCLKNEKNSENIQVQLEILAYRYPV